MIARLQKASLLVLLIILGFGASLTAQSCSCEDCPLVVPQVGSDQTCIDISGLTNGTLNSGGQGVCELFIDFQHTKIADINMSLIAPDGSSVDLVFNTFGGATTGQFWNVTFLQCADTPVPDPGFPAVFPSDGWQDGVTYTGSYYPGNGCFEDLTGPANGTWCLFVQDPFIGDVTVINDWSITFCDDDGLSCGASSCIAEGGVSTDLDDTNYCEGDQLDNPTVSGALSDPDYGYQFYVRESGLPSNPILLMDENPDISSLPEGLYILCGFSYLLSDGPSIPTPNGSYSTTDLENDIAAGAFCADLTEICLTFSISPSPPLTFEGPTLVCPGVEYIYSITDWDPANGSYGTSILMGGFNQFINIGGGQYSVIWNDATTTGQLCANLTSSCGFQQDCLNVVIGGGAELGLSTPTTTCVGQSTTVVWTEESDYTYTAYTNSGVIGSFVQSPGMAIFTPITDEDIEICVEAVGPCGTVTTCEIIEVFITPTPPALDFVTPVCSGEQITITNLDFNPDYTYVLTNSCPSCTFTTYNGEMAVFVMPDGVASVNVCFGVANPCGSTAACGEVFSNGSSTANPGILGELNTCYGEEYIYTATDLAGIASYTWSVDPGEDSFIVSESGDQVTVGLVDPPVQFSASICLDYTTDCGNTDQFCIDITPPSDCNNCDAEGGGISLPQTTYCLGDAALLLSPNVTGQNSDPEFGYTFAVSDITSGQGPILSYEVSPDLTSFPVGTYSVCGLSYFIADEPLITPADGSNTADDLVADISAGTFCGDLADACVNIEIIDPPTLTNETLVDTCGPDFDLVVLVDGVVGSGSWQQLLGPSTTVFESPTSSVTGADAPALGTYEFRFTSDCGNFIDVQITLTQDLDSPDFTFECQPGGGYIVTITMTPGIGPYIIDGVLTVDDNVYMTDVLFSPTTFFLIAAEGGCRSWLQSVTPGCPGCTSDAGTVATPTSGVIAVCDDAIVINTNGDEFLDGNDSQLFILHSDANDPLGTTLLTSTDGTFSFGAPLSYGTTYFISHAVGTAAGTSIDFTDPCLSISPSVGIIFSEPFDLQGITVDPIGICSDDFTFTIVQNPNISFAGLWSVPVLPPGGSVDISTAQGYSVDIAFTGSGTYEVQYFIADGVCSDQISVTVVIVDAFSISDPTYECDAGNTNYTVTYEILGGNPPLTIDGTLLTGTIYESPPLESGDSYSYEVMDADGCTAELSGSYECDCESDAGTISPVDLITSCDEQDIVVNSNGDAFLDADDASVFIIHTDPNDPVGSLVETNTSGLIIYGPQFDYGAIYYVTFAVGNQSGTGLDYTDPCLSLSNTVSFQFLEPVGFQSVTSVPVDACGSDWLITVVDDWNINGTWFASVRPPGESAFFSPVQGDITTVTFTGPGTYVVDYLLANGDCSVFVKDTIEIAAPPLVDNLQQTCIGDDSYEVSFDINGGISPYTVNGTDVGIGPFASDPIAAGTSYSFTVTDANGCEVGPISGVHDCGCESDAGTMAITLVEVCGDGPVSVTGLGDASLDSDDQLTYVLHTSPTAELGSVISTDATGLFGFVNPMVYGVTYYISAVVGDGTASGVDLTDDCLSVAIGQPIIFYEEPIITSIVVSPTVSCTQDFDLVATTTITDDGIWSSSVTPPGGVVVLSNIFGDATTATVTVPGTYTMNYQLNVGTCVVVDQVSFIYEPNPISLQLQEYICEADGLSYQAIVEIVGGTGPYTIDGTTLTGTTYMATGIPSGTTLSLSVTDANGCGSSPLVVSHTCPNSNCDNDAGLMETDQLDICGNGPALVNAIGNATLATGATLTYVLHTLPGNTLGTVLAENMGGTFEFLPSMTYGVTYYVSLVVGDEVGNTVDLNDPCLSVAAGQPVVYYEDVNYGNVSSQLIDLCEGTYLLSAEPTVGYVGQWAVVSSPSAGLPVISATVGSTTIVTISEPGDYAISYSIENGPCSADTTISFTYDYEPLQVEVSGVNCEPDGTYTTTISILSGSLPYSVNGAVVNDTTYTIVGTASGVSLPIVVTDANDCDTVTTTVVEDCSCISDAGFVVTATQEFCDTAAIVQFTVMDTILDTNDDGYFIIYTDAGDPLGSIVTTLYDGIVTYASGLYVQNTVYYISYLVGDAGPQSIVSSDPCLSISNQSSFVYQECNCDVSIDIEGSVELCEGNFITMPITVDGPLPIEVTLLDGDGQPSTYNIISPADTVIMLPGTASTSYTVQSATSGLGCNVEFVGTYTVTVLLPPVPVVEPQVTVCNTSAEGSIVVLADQLISTDIAGVWTDPQGMPVSGTIDFAGFAPGLYGYTYSTIDFLPCEQQLSVMTVTVQDCTCPSEVLVPQAIDLCQDDGSIDLSQYFADISIDGSWSISSIDGTIEPVITNDQMTLTNAHVGDYILQFVASGLQPQCDSVFTLPVTIHAIPISGIAAAEIVQVCQGDDVALELFDYLQEYDTGGTWTTAGGVSVGSSSGQVVGVLVPGTYVFDYTVMGHPTCSPQTTSVIIQVDEPASTVLLTEDPICFGGTEGSVSIMYENGAEVDDIMIYDTDGVIQTAGSLAAGTYAIVGIDSLGCAIADEFIIVDPAELVLDLGADIEVMAGSTTVVTSQLTGSTANVSLYQWFVNEAMIDGPTTDTLTLIPTGETMVELVVADDDGCLTTDDLLITTIVDNTEIVMPNIFSPQAGGFGVPAFASISIVNRLAVYDRWGSEVYLATNYAPSTSAQQWDGSFQGQLVPQGVYVYIVEYTDVLGRRQQLAGDVTVLQR